MDWGRNRFQLCCTASILHYVWISFSPSPFLTHSHVRIRLVIQLQKDPCKSCKARTPHNEERTRVLEILSSSKKQSEMAQSQHHLQRQIFKAINSGRGRLGIGCLQNFLGSSKSKLLVHPKTLGISDFYSKIYVFVLLYFAGFLPSIFQENQGSDSLQTYVSAMDERLSTLIIWAWARLESRNKCLLYDILQCVILENIIKNTLVEVQSTGLEASSSSNNWAIKNRFVFHSVKLTQFTRPFTSKTAIFKLRSSTALPLNGIKNHKGSFWAKRFSCKPKHSVRMRNGLYRKIQHFCLSGDGRN